MKKNSREGYIWPKPCFEYYTICNCPNRSKCTLKNKSYREKKQSVKKQDPVAYRNYYCSGRVINKKKDENHVKKIIDREENYAEKSI